MEDAPPRVEAEAKSERLPAEPVDAGNLER
jgi:hypothetical protein